MAKLGTLWFGSDIDLSGLRRKIEQGNRDVLNALKIKYDAKSYSQMTAELRSRLRKENFEVGIVVNQTKVSKAVQAALSQAGLSGNTTAGMVRAAKISAIQTAEADKHALAMQRLAKAQMSASRAANGHASQLIKLNAHLGHGITLGGRLSEAVGMIWSVGMLKQYATRLIEIGGEFQKQRIALETMLGSMAKADAMYGRMKELAVESPFTFMDLMSYTKQLKAFQIPYNELFDTTKRLADISAGLGVDMNRIILAYGQVRSAAFLRGQEVRQFTEAGIPLLDALAKKFSELEGRVVSVGEVFDKISKRQVSFQMVKDVLWELTDEGGMFYNMQSKLTESLSGKLDKLRDSYEIALAEIAQGNHGALSFLLDTLTAITSHLGTMIGLVGTAGAAWMTYRVAVALANTAHKQGFLYSAYQGLMNMIKALRGATVAQTALNAATIVNPYVAFATALTTIIGVLLTFVDVTDSATDKLRKLNAEHQSQIDKINENSETARAYIRTIKDQTKSVDAQKSAYDNLTQIYPELFKNMDFEQVKRMRSIDLLNMESKAAKEAMRNKLMSQKQDLEKLRKSQAEELDDLKNSSAGGFLGSFLGFWRKKAEPVHTEKIIKAREALIDTETSISNIDKALSDIYKRDEQESINRQSRWHKEATELAKGLKGDYAPKKDEMWEEYYERTKKSLEASRSRLKGITKSAEIYEDTKKEVEVLGKIYHAIGGADEGLKGNGGGGSKTTDPLLKSAKSRLDSLKSFIAEYKKFKDTYGENEAVNKAESIFPEFSGKGHDVLANHKKYFSAILDMPHKAGAEWDKFTDSVRKAMEEQAFAVDKEAIEKAISRMNKYIDDAIKKFDLFKSLKEKAGRDFAQSAFVDGRVWDNLSRDLADKLKNMLGLSSIDWMMDEDTAKLFFDGNQQAYDLWKKIVELTRRNYVDGLNNAASAINEVMRIEDKILKIEQELSELRGRNDGIDHSSEIKKKELELSKARQEQFEQSADYVNFYAAPLALARDELERIGDEIRLRLTAQLGRGEITARQYTKAIKDVNENLAKGRAAFGGNGMTFLRGGIPGLMTLSEQKQSMSDDRYARASEDVKKAEEDLAKAREKGALSDILAAEARLSSARVELDAATRQKAEADRVHEALSKVAGAFAGIADIVAIVSGALQGLQGIAQELSETFDALGNEKAANDFSDIADGIGGVMSSVDAIGSIVQSAMKGDISGIVSNALMAPVKIFTGPIKAFAQLHDKQMQREIEASVRRQEEMEALTDSLESALERSISGIYGLRANQSQMDMLDLAYKRDEAARNPLNKAFGRKGYLSDKTRSALNEARESTSYYDSAYAALLVQRDEIQHQMDSEREKKKSDKDALASYKTQLEELDEKILYYAQDMAEAIYGIDFKGYAESLADSLVDAWAKGEDGAEAYKQAVGDILRDIMKNVVAQNYIGAMLGDINDKNSILGKFYEDFAKNDGILSEDGISQLSNIFSVLENTVTAVNNAMDSAEAEANKRNYTMKDTGSSSSSSSGSIKSITESTADLLASYINAIRADVSVNRAQLSVYLPQFQELLSQGNSIAQAQVTHLEQIAINTQRNAEAASAIQTMVSRMENGATSLKVRY